MERTLLAGDFLFVISGLRRPRFRAPNAACPFQSPERGDVIVFAYPKIRPLSYVKRVIGAPGDIVGDAGWGRCSDGRALEEPYVQRVDPAA